MKLIFITYNEALDNEVTEMLAERGVKSWTKWIKVQGRGEASEPHLGSHVWPKNNNVIAAVTGDEAAERAMEGVRELRKSFAKEGVKAFVVPCEAMT